MAGTKGRSGGARQGAGRKPKTVRVPADKAFGFWHGLDEYEQEFFAKACEYAGIKPTRANILKQAKSAAQAGINQAMQRVFEQYKQDREIELSEGGSMDNFDAIETIYQNERASSQMLRDLIAEGSVPPVATVEQITTTKRGSCSWDHHQVLSWKDQKHVMTATDVTVEATYLTLTEAQMYCKHLQEQGILAEINPGL